MNTPPLRVRADTRCLNERQYVLGTYYCLHPHGHEGKCRKWTWGEFIEVYSVEPNRELA